MYQDKFVEIMGFVKQKFAGYSHSFVLEVLKDSIEGVLPSSNEINVHIRTNFYPNDYFSRFERAPVNTYNRQSINECIEIRRHLQIGDLVKCQVFIVNTDVDSDGRETHIIDGNPDSIKRYKQLENPLWLYPNCRTFERLEGDVLKTLKFRKKQYFSNINEKKCRKITGIFYLYSDKWWVNKNPKLIFWVFWGIRLKTRASKIWENVKNMENLQKVSVAANIILAIATLILTIILITKS